ncbi:MAG: hypothetical protein OEX02_00400 [Cyclobacteriaceae bacterium]|nr:hypothetical protein [Cyclobacteriaceae bacterium]
MRSIIVFIWITFLFSSCVDLGFDTPQPEGYPDIALFPTEWLGTYISDEDTLVIKPYSVLVEKDSVYFNLNAENLVLRKFQNWYILNLKEPEKDYWTVFCARLKGDKLTVKVPSIDEDDKKALEKQFEVNESYNSNGNVDAYIIHPTPKQWKKLLKSKFFSSNNYVRQR